MIEEEKIDANRVKQSSSSGGMLSWLMGGNQAQSKSGANKSEFVEEEVKDNDDKVGSKVNKYSQ